MSVCVDVVVAWGRVGWRIVWMSIFLFIFLLFVVVVLFVFKDCVDELFLEGCVDEFLSGGLCG